MQRLGPALGELALDLLAASPAAPAGAARARRARRAGRGPVPPTTIGRRPSASSASISAWASSAKRPALNSSVGSTNAEQPVLEPLALGSRRGAAEDLEARGRPGSSRS